MEYFAYKKIVMVSHEKYSQLMGSDYTEGVEYKEIGNQKKKIRSDMILKKY